MDLKKEENKRPYVLTIAGFDPSAGAGLLADIKTMEQHEVYGLSVCTAITVQTDRLFQRVEWLEVELIKQQLSLLLQEYKFEFCKIGLIQNWQVLETITDILLEYNPAIKIIVDPIFRASAGFNFHQETREKHLKSWLSKIYLLTPNALELEQIDPNEKDLMTTAKQLANYCHLLYKGGHNEAQKGTDFLFMEDKIHTLKPMEAVYYDKHGSGCVLSAAITSNLALGYSLLESCSMAKIYITRILNSNETLLAHHYQK